MQLDGLLFSVQVMHVEWQELIPRVIHEVGGESFALNAFPLAVLQILHKEGLLFYEQVMQFILLHVDPELLVQLLGGFTFSAKEKP